MQRLLTLSLEQFGASALSEQAEKHSVTPVEFGQLAVRYYLSDRPSGRVALKVPRLAQEPTRESALELTLDLDPDSWRELDQEAQRQDVPVERLLAHAIIYCLADLDAGRVEWRTLEAGRQVSESRDSDG